MLTLCSTLSPLEARAQQEPAGGSCAEVDAAARGNCVAAYDAMAAVGPQLGTLASAGIPGAGTAGNLGRSFGARPRVSAYGTLGVLGGSMPELLGTGAVAAAGRPGGSASYVAIGLRGGVAVGVLPGFSVSPRLGGVGAVDLLVNASLLPLGVFKVPGFESGSNPLGLGAGVRVGLLGESFTLPAASVVVGYNWLGRVSYGDVCSGKITPAADAAGLCSEPDDRAEFSSNVEQIDLRLALSRSALGLGLLGGVGHSWFWGDGTFAAVPTGATGNAVPISSGELRMREGRWSAFGEASYRFLLTTFSFQAGWLGGREGSPGRASGGGSLFDAGNPTFFGSFAAQFAI